MLKSLRFWIGVGFTLLFLFLFLYRTDFAEMGRALGGANYLFLLPGLLVYFIGVFFRSVRWRYLLKPIGIFSPLRLFPLIVIGFLVNNVLPARLGIVARAYILGERRGVSKMATAGTIVVEQVFDGVTLLLFAAIVSLFGVSVSGVLQNTLYIVAGLLLVALALCFALALSPRLARRVISMIVHVLPRRWRGRMEEWLRLLIEGLGIMRSPRKLLIVLIISVLVWLCEASVFYLMGFAFDLELPFYAFLLAASDSNLAWAVLMTPGGLGPFDYFCQQTLILFGVAEAVATSYVVALHAIILLPMSALGFIFLWWENLSLSKIVPRAKQGLEAAPDSKEAEG